MILFNRRKEELIKAINRKSEQKKCNIKKYINSRSMNTLLEKALLFSVQDKQQNLQDKFSIFSLGTMCTDCLTCTLKQLNVILEQLKIRLR